MSAGVVRAARAEEILDLRHAVLRAGLPREAAGFAGDDDAATRHFAAEIGGRVVGCATILLSEWDGEAAWQLRGMAVDPRFRGGGVGRKLVEAAEAFVRGSGQRVMWCNARTPAAAFYERMGWKVASVVFEAPTAGPHVRMSKRL